MILLNKKTEIALLAGRISAMVRLNFATATLCASLLVTSDSDSHTSSDSLPTHWPFSLDYRYEYRDFALENLQRV